MSDGPLSSLRLAQPGESLRLHLQCHPSVSAKPDPCEGRLGRVGGTEGRRKLSASEMDPCARHFYLRVRQRTAGRALSELRRIDAGRGERPRLEIRVHELAQNVDVHPAGSGYAGGTD